MSPTNIRDMDDAGSDDSDMSLNAALSIPSRSAARARIHPTEPTAAGSALATFAALAALTPSLKPHMEKKTKAPTPKLAPLMTHSMLDKPLLSPSPGFSPAAGSGSKQQDAAFTQLLKAGPPSAKLTKRSA